MSEAALDLEQGVLAWLERRRQACGAGGGWAWVRQDPVTACLLPWLRRLEDQGRLRLDAEARRQSGQAYYANQGRRLAWQAGADAIAADLQAGGFALIALKGAVLRETIYPDPGLRRLGDIDLLVPEEVYPAAARRLLALGLRLHPENGFSGLEGFGELGPQDWPPEVIFQGEGGLVVELHRHLVSTEWFLPAYPIDLVGVWARAEAAPGSQGPARLAPADQLAHLCLHQAMHGLQAMHAYLDVDLFLRQLPPGWDWEAFLGRVEAWQMRSAVFHAFLIGRHFLGSPLPAGLLERLDPGPAARWRVRRLISPQDLLAARPAPGRRYPTLVKLALVDRATHLLGLAAGTLLPGREWLRRRYRENPSLKFHWQHVFQVVRRGD